MLFRSVPSGNAYLDETELPGGHCYQIGVLCEAGESGEYSNESCATAGPCYPPRDLDFELASNNKIKLKWKTPLPSETRLSGYYLYRKEGDGEYHRIKLLGPGAVSYIDNSLIAQGDYYYRLYAYYGDLDFTSSPANRHYYPNVFELHAYYSPTGVIEAETSVKVYPNPTQGLVNVEADNMTHVAVYNLLGQCVLQKDISDSRTVLDLRNAVSGLYLLRITTSEGTLSRRITIEP